MKLADLSTGISIHAPREGCDRLSPAYPDWRRNFNPRTPRGVRPAALSQLGPQRVFQSTHPARGATAPDRGGFRAGGISIHAPREGCDGQSDLTYHTRPHFNPRTPRGVRRPGVSPTQVRAEFQSTHPARGATPARCQPERCRPEFQSTHPARGATANFTKEQGVCLAQFAYLHKGKKAEHTKTNAPMLH